MDDRPISRTRSTPRATRTRTRSRSRPRSRPGSPPLHRLLSNQFPDDYSVYHLEEGEGVHVDADARSLNKTETERRGESSGSSSEEEDDNVEEKDAAAHEDETTYQEIRGGIPYEHDVEAGKKLEREKSARSVKDPNLVSRVQFKIAVFRSIVWRTDME